MVWWSVIRRVWYGGLSLGGYGMVVCHIGGYGMVVYHIGGYGMVVCHIGR